MAAAIFICLTLWSVHFSVAKTRLVEHGYSLRTATSIDLPQMALLFYVSLYIGFMNGVFSRELVSPVAIAIGLAVGHLIFFVSAVLTHLDWRVPLQYFTHLGTLWNYVVDNPTVLTRFISVAFGEELIYRVVMQPIVIGYLDSQMPTHFAAGIGIIVVAIAFCIVHQHFFYNTWYVSLEFVIFAVTLGILYFLTKSFTIVLLIHALRDIEINHLEFKEKFAELGNENEARKSVEDENKPSRARSLYQFFQDTPGAFWRSWPKALLLELFWRIGVQSGVALLLSYTAAAPYAMLGSALVATAGFVCAQWYFTRPSWQHLLEIITVGALLSAVYAWSNSYWLTAAIHGVRNAELAYLKYLEDANPDVDSNASEEIDVACSAQRLEKV